VHSRITSRPGSGTLVFGHSDAARGDVVALLAGITDVRTAASPAELLAALRAGEPASVVIVDGQDGAGLASLLAAVRAARPTLPLFVVLAADGVVRAVEAMRAGATAVVEVPPNGALLREQVREAQRR
jgi:DNA-binding NtrC family response regulator